MSTGPVGRPRLECHRMSDQAACRLAAAGMKTRGRGAEEYSVRSSTPRSAGARSAYGHAFADVASDGEVLGAALPYLEGGLRAGDLVTLSASPETVALISRALGEPARQLQLDRRIALRGARPPDALSVIGRYAEEAARR